MEKFKQLYNELMALKYEPNQVFLQLLLNAENFQENLFSIVRLYNTIKHFNVELTTTTYNILFKIFISQKEYTLFEEVYNQMLSNKVKPNLFTINLLLEFYLSHEENTQFLKTFEMVSEYNIVPDSTTYNHLLEYHIRQQDFVRFFQVLTTHFELPKAISQIIRVNNDDNQNRDQSKQTQTQTSTVISNEQTKPSTTTKVLPTTRTYNLLIRYYAITNQHEKIPDVFNFLATSRDSLHPTGPDNETFNILIETLPPETVTHYWDYMKSKYHVTPNLSNYLTMLNFCARTNNVNLANSVLQRFFNSNVIGTVAIPSIYISNVLQANKHPVSKKLREWLDKLLKEKLQQNSYILTKKEVAEFEQIVFISKFKIK
jgi:pentatricopeptide repeat protein